MKMILVPGCNDCPHGAQWNLGKSEYLCSKTRKVNKNPNKPLKECPLHDGMAIIRQFLEIKNNG